MTQDNPNRRWHDLYDGRPGIIEPASSTALEMFRATAARHGDRALVHYFDQSITAAQIDAMSDSLAVALQQRGTEPGDRIAVHLQNIPQVVIAVLAAWKCGAAVVPCNPMWRERELTTVLRDSGARVLICQDDLYREVAHAALPSTAIQHTLTTSALDFLAGNAVLPRVLAGSSREPRAEGNDLLELIAARHPDPAAEVALRDARPQSQNGFKVELAKRCLVHALDVATRQA